MAKNNAANERIKRDYFRLLKEGRGYDEASIDSVAQAIHRFEQSTRFKAFDRFHIEQAIAFKRWLPRQLNQRTGKPLAKATLMSTMRSLREFFLWLSGQSGFRSRISHGDAGYFRLSEKESRAAKRTLAKPVPTLDQIEMVLQAMPAETIIQRRDRAVVALIILTGARDAAVASLKLKHLDTVERLLTQDGREVRTKASKTILTWFFPIGGTAEGIVREWAGELRAVHGWGETDALFPSTDVRLAEDGQFAAKGLKRANWASADPIRKIFRAAFKAAGLPYSNPHSLRSTLAQLGERVCKSPEEFKVWSQNLGHEQVSTTFTSYGAVPAHRQAEVIRGLVSRPHAPLDGLAEKLARAGLRLMTIE
jgi:integrase